MTTDFFTIDYLLRGSAIQQKGHKSLIESGVFHVLEKYDPVLAGTLPLNIFIDGSDLDILCYAPDLSAFENDVLHFSRFDDFSIHKRPVKDIPSVISRFIFQGFEFELFGQPVPTCGQTAYRHLVVEHAILQREDENFLNKIIVLKKSGLKTEPAFAHVLNLPGDPYEALLNYSISA